MAVEEWAGAGAYGVPPKPAVPPRVPADRLRAAAVALLNLTGLGLGYALLRRWLPVLGCVVATGVLLVVVLPARPDGPPAGLLAAYAAVLLFAAVHGAAAGLRTFVRWRSPVALLLGVVLLAVPVGGALLYGSARDAATERMLLGRLRQADAEVQAAKGLPFATAEPRYRQALAQYRDLTDHHPQSEAARRVPASLAAYYRAVAAPYDQGRYCDAVAPLTYLRTLPGVLGARRLGPLAGWPDDRLATALYRCGTGGLGSGGSSGAGPLGVLLATFPHSRQAAGVEPAVGAAIDAVAAAVGQGDPCGATARLRALRAQAAALPGAAAGLADALGRDTGRADHGIEAGTYACGVAQYRGGSYGDALTTFNGFLDTYQQDPNRALAQKYAVAAEVAQQDPAAGRTVPTLASGGDIAVTFENDSPDPVRVLYTGPVTGSLTLPACSACTAYPNDAAGQNSACKDTGRAYPQRTVDLPTGTEYFLHEPQGDSGATPGSDSTTLRSGYVYTECAFVVDGLGTTTS
jgi:hypothetical protein